MEILENKIESDRATIKVALVVDGLEDGKVTITKRWQTAAYVLQKDFDITDMELTQIDAGYENINEYRQRTQEFTFFFKKKDIMNEC